MSDYVIETRGLTKTYGEQNSVSNLSIHVRKGSIYGLLGRNLSLIHISEPTRRTPSRMPSSA